MKTSNSYIKIHTGISSVIMLLVVLCLTMFALLSYSTAQSDLSLTKKTAEHTYNYYYADLKSEQTISEISKIMLSNIDLELLASELSQNIEALSSVEHSEDGYYIVKFITSVDKTQNMETVIKMNLLTSSKRKLEVSKHLISTQEFQEIQDIEVWQGI